MVKSASPASGEVSVTGSPRRYRCLSLVNPANGRRSLPGLDIQKLEPLAELHKLLWLDLRGTKVSDLRPLAGLTQLQHLQLHGTPVTDTSPLAGLADLTIYGGPDGPEAKPRQP